MAIEKYCGHRERCLPFSGLVELYRYVIIVLHYIGLQDNSY